MGGGAVYLGPNGPSATSVASDQDQYLQSPPVPSTAKQYRIESAPDVPDDQIFQELPLEVVSELDSNKPKEQRQSVITYEVTPGDTVAGIAQRFSVSPETIIWANQLGDGDLISVGEKLLILPVDGVLHTVASGDTLDSIARRYGVEWRAIFDYEPNQLVDSNSLVVGQKLTVPGGEPKEGLWLAWPTYGYMTQYFHAYHQGIDIAAPTGTPLYAAASGRVVKAVKLAWSYGWYLVIDHGYGFETLYGHCSQFAVGVGERVERGQIIAWMGSTGRTTGPHLHFEVRYNGQAVNPLNYLP